MNRINIVSAEELLNYTIVFLIIACSGFPYFVASYYLMPISFLLVLMICLNRRIGIVDLKLFYILIFLLTIAAVREIIHGYEISLYILLVIILKYSFPYYVIKLTGFKFLTYYRKVLYVISIISIAIFVLVTLFPGIEIYLTGTIAPFFEEHSKNGYYTYAPNIIIYTFNEHARNHGPFWEAGGFGVFIIIALIFQMIEKKRLFDKYGVVFILAAITTFSTATYISLAFLISIYVIRMRNKNFRMLLIPVLFFVIFKVYYSAEFLRNKIATNYDVVSGHYQDRVANRFTSVLLDLNKIVENPLFGNPQNTGERYTVYSHRNNGLSSMAVEYGIVYFIVFFILIFKAFKQMLMINFKWDPIIVLSFMVAIMAVYFGQVLTDKPMLNLLALIPFVLKRFILQQPRLSNPVQY